MNHLPLWFLILALFLPRVSLIAGYFLDTLQAYSLNGFVPPALAVLIPRVLVLILIFQDIGMSAWLFVHALVMVFVYLAAGGSK